MPWISNSPAARTPSISSIEKSNHSSESSTGQHHADFPTFQPDTINLMPRRKPNLLPLALCLLLAFAALAAEFR
ncbi:MAG: hypothetical protein J0L64_21485, partial [Acidobacteria bacterium]|nr:hypothetical protein [Acidobacteriota bacterium]